MTMLLGSDNMGYLLKRLPIIVAELCKPKAPIANFKILPREKLILLLIL